MIINGGVNLDIGDTLSLDIGERKTEDGYRLNRK